MTSFLFPLIKKSWAQGWSKNYSTKMCALDQGEENLFLEKDAFFVKDKKVISAKFSVNISTRYVMYVNFYHYTGNLWDSATLEIVSCGNLTRTIAVLTAFI